MYKGSNLKRYGFCYFLFLLISCKKFIEVPPPVDQLTTSAVFSNDETANAAALGMYSDIMRLNNYIGNGGMTIYCGLSADELSTTSLNSTYEPFRANALVPTNSTLLTFIWQKAFFHIYQANALLENLDRSQVISEKLKNQLKGEALFIRSFFHFYLANLFGKIPLVTTTDYKVNSSITQSDLQAIYGQIITDLKKAEDLLPEKYSNSEKVRPNKWAAAAFLARVYLYSKDWVDAEHEASEVIDSKAYRMNALSSVFLPNSDEAILQWIPPITQIFNSAEGFAFIPANTTTVPLFVLSKNLKDSFEAGDGRLVSWVRSITINGTTYNYPYKYKVRSGTAGAQKSEYNMVLRLAEQYLIRAEARAEQNNLSGAMDDLNTVRTRAGLPVRSLNSQVEILNAIEKERQIEFFAEWGHRFFDLKRTGMADGVLSVEKSPSWQSTDTLYPVPQAEIDKNPSLKQNPGY
jgi:starch-binding outer membrane protein, SusD/RagB family